ncbi:Uncharacterised protein [Ewingella americana]|uniref:Uncharacterized protein n=1 Tax=Ewingella americana TaxID=41202 RepID=A0A377NDW9_9GAMM|nr:Uncharacterised protein [Ewingella americana]
MHNRRGEEKGLIVIEGGFNCKFWGIQGQDRGLAAHTGPKVKVVRCRHTGLKSRLSPRLLRISGSLLRAVAG